MKGIKIQSMSDIITNSSSEVFIIESDKTWQEVQEEIKSWELKKDDGGSGMGKFCEVFDNKREYPSENFMTKEPMFPWLGDHHLAIDIDWSMKKTIDKIFKELKVVDAEEMDIVVDKETRRAKRIWRGYDGEKLYDGEVICEGCENIVDDLKTEYYTSEKERLREEICKITDFETAEKISLLFHDYQYAEITLHEIEYDKKERESRNSNPERE